MAPIAATDSWAWFHRGTPNTADPESLLRRVPMRKLLGIAPAKEGGRPSKRCVYGARAMQSIKCLGSRDFRSEVRCAGWRQEWYPPLSEAVG